MTLDFRRLLNRVVLAGLLLPATGWTQQVLHTEPSSFSPVVVYEENGERCMTFGSVRALGRQTCYALASPKRMVFNYTRMMMSALYVQPDPQRILVIGLGGGTLPMALADLLPRSHIDVVEIDPAVQRVAQQYFGLTPNERLVVHQADGREYVHQAVQEHRRYDLVLLDAFDVNYIPRHLMTREFLRDVKALLSPAGVLAANTFSTSALYDRESATYADVFGPSFNLQSNNRVILAVNGPLPDDAAIERHADRWREPLKAYGVDPASAISSWSRTDGRYNKDDVLTD